MMTNQALSRDSVEAGHRTAEKRRTTLRWIYDFGSFHPFLIFLSARPRWGENMWNKKGKKFEMAARKWIMGPWWNSPPEKYRKEEEEEEKVNLFSCLCGGGGTIVFLRRKREKEGGGGRGGEKKEGEEILFHTGHRCKITSIPIFGD